MPSKKQSGFGLIFLVIFLVSWAALVIGAIYYYSEIFRPKQYTQEIISLTGSFKTELATPNTDSVPAKDYQQTVTVLAQRQKILYSLRDRFDKIKPVPPKMRQINDDVSFGIEYFLAANAEAQKQAVFLAKLKEMGDILKPDPPPFDQNKAYIRDYQSYFETQIPRVKLLGDRLFDDPPTTLQGVTITQLKTVWQEYESGIDLILELIRAQDPTKPMAGYTPVPPTEKQKQALDQGNNFGRLVEEVFRQNTTYSLLTYKNFTAIPKQKLDERGQRLDSSIDQLKKQYHLTSP